MPLKYPDSKQAAAFIRTQPLLYFAGILILPDIGYYISSLKFMVRS